MERSIVLVRFSIRSIWVKSFFQLRVALIDLAGQVFISIYKSFAEFGGCISHVAILAINGTSSFPLHPLVRFCTMLHSRLLTGALPGPSRRLRARHPELPCAQRPLLSPAPLRVRRPLECPLQWEPRGQPGLSLSPPGPPARARRCGCRRLAAPLFGGGGGTDSCCRRRSAGPGGCSASAPPRPPAAPPAPGPV